MNDIMTEIYGNADHSDGDISTQPLTPPNTPAFTEVKTSETVALREEVRQLSRRLANLEVFVKCLVRG